MTTETETIVLVGLMGTGKTTIAKVLATRRGLECLDTDRMIESREGKSVRDIFSKDGEDAFRILETSMLTECLQRPGGVVIAAAGGAVVREENRRVLDDARQRKGVIVVWLHGRPEVLAQRTAKGVHRPLLDQDRQATLEKMSEERGPLYASVADIVIDVSDRDVDSIVGLLVEALDEGQMILDGSNG